MERPDSVRVFGRLLPRIFDYADRTAVAADAFEEYFELESDWQKYPDGWEGNVLGMLAGVAACGTPGRVERFLTEESRALDAEELALAEEWRHVPWTHVALGEAEPADPDRPHFVTAVPVGDPPQGWPDDLSWEHLTIYSPTLSERVGQGRTTAIALLWYDGELFHTYGVILSFKNFAVEDLLFFADVVRGEREADQQRGVTPLLGVVGRTTAVSTLIRRDPLTFLRLFPYQHAPPPQGPGGPWFRTASVALWPGDTPLTEGKLWRTLLSDGGYPPQVADMYPDAGAILLGTGSFMEEPRIYLSTAGEPHVLLAAVSDEAYQRGVAALTGIVNMPTDPQCRTSIIMYRAALEILDFEDEVEVFDGLFEDVLLASKDPPD